LGEVIPYWYLWWREHERGEDSGRKLRPCVVIAAAVEDAAVLLAVLPVTHVEPDQDRAAIEVPLKIKNHLGLDRQRSWVMCDEQNEFHWPGFDLGKTPSGQSVFGAVPDRVLHQLRERHRQVRMSGALKSASRD
jgi:hypothetical protein